MEGSSDIPTAIFQWSMVIISISTGLINFLVLRMFAKFRTTLLQNNVHNRILCSLCFADSLVGTFGTILGVLLLTRSPPSAYKLAGNIPLFSCMFASVISLALLTADRLVAIKRPFMYGTPTYLRCINRLLFATWCVPLYITLQQVVIFLTVSSAKELQVRSLLFVIFFCVGSASLFVTNAMLYYSIRRYSVKRKSIGQTTVKATRDAGELSARIAAPQPTNIADAPATSSASQSSKSAKNAKSTVERELRRTSILCIVIVTTFLLLWTPLAVYRFLYALGESLSLAWLRRLCLCLTVSNSLLNPAIYFYFRRKLRMHFVKLFLSVVGRERSVGDTSRAN